MHVHITPHTPLRPSKNRVSGYLEHPAYRQGRPLCDYCLIGPLKYVLQSGRLTVYEEVQEPVDEWLHKQTVQLLLFTNKLNNQESGQLLTSLFGYFNY